MIDTHCHLNLSPLRESWETYYNHALEAGVKKLIVIGTDEETSQTAWEQAQKKEQIWWSSGLHPCSVTSNWPATQNQFQNFFQKEKLVAIGEIGLDFFRSSNKEEQFEALGWFFDQAKSHKKPVILHIREAFSQLKTFLKHYGTPPKGVIHCFTGNQSDADFCLSEGFFLSFSGILTFKKTLDIQNIAQKTPLEAILLETDSPYLSPEPYRGKTNEPQRVKFVYEKLANLKNLPLQNLENQIQKNTQRLFKI